MGSESPEGLFRLSEKIYIDFNIASGSHRIFNIKPSSHYATFGLSKQTKSKKLVQVKNKFYPQISCNAAKMCGYNVKVPVVAS